MIAGGLGKVHPRRPVVRAVLHTFVGSAEPLNAFANDDTAHRVMAAVIDAQHRASLLQEGIAILLEHARAIEVAANAVVQDDHIDAKLRGTLHRGLTPGTVKAYTIMRCHID